MQGKGKHRVKGVRRGPRTTGAGAAMAAEAQEVAARDPASHRPAEPALGCMKSC